MKRLVVLAGLAAMLVGGVVACGNSTGGQPTPVTTSQGSGQTTGGGSTGATSSTGGQQTLPVDRPCSLLSSSDLTQIGVSSPPIPDMVGNAHDCSLTIPNYSIGVAIRTDGGLAGFAAPGDTVHDKAIGRHQAKEKVDNTGSCVIAIGVTSSSRVDVTATGDGTTNPCPTAEKVAALIEPKLP